MGAVHSMKGEMTGQGSTSQYRFDLKWNRGGITSLKLVDDAYDTDYIREGETLGEVVIRYRLGQDPWREAAAFASGDIRRAELDASGTRTFSYAGEGQLPRGIRDLCLVEQFSLRGDSLVWTLRFRNDTDQALELGDIALPLPFQKEFTEDNRFNYTQCVARHSFVSGYGSFIFWERPNGVGPYLVMTPLPNTKIEYYEEHDVSGRVPKTPYWPYIHSAVGGAGETRGTWRQPHTSVILAPKGSPGDEVEYGFTFQWAPDYDGVHDVLYREGLFDVQVVPGMSLPRDLYAMFSLRTRNRIDAIEPEHAAQTEVEYLGEREEATHLYRVKFARLGENLLTVRYGEGRWMVLEFFVTEPLETLIKKRAAFLVNKQQHRDPSKWYNGLISVWDMKNRVLRSPDDTDGFDGWWGYVLACDDTALPKAPYIAAKNLHYPVPEEIEAIEYYIENFVWGKLQRPGTEDPYPYGIYGVPNWYENRHSEHGFGTHGRGLEHVWRSYDYPHVIMLYLHMYQIARQYPGLVRYLDWDGYLERAFGTARAYFTIQGTIKFSRGGYEYWAYTRGIYNELLIVDLIEALEQEGRAEQAEWLRKEWEKKVKFFVYDDPYPFDSEYPFDTTAFESSHAIARYGLAHAMQADEDLWYDRAKGIWYSHPQVRRADFQAFMDKQIQANIALRGWLEPAFYLLGSDYRGGTSSRYQLSYMSQMGGWAIVDYALYQAQAPSPYLQLGYASYLSSWALMNTGTPESNYGYWFPGRENDGASGWAFLPEKYGPMWIRKHQGRGAWLYDGEIDLGYAGALRTAATIVMDDPLFGFFAYGGLLSRTDQEISALPRDGLRKRFHLIQGEQRLHLLLERDGFSSEKPIVVERSLHRVRFTLENRSQDDHRTVLRVAGLPAGVYDVMVSGKPLCSLTAGDGDWRIVEIPVEDSSLLDVEIRANDWRG